MWLDFTFILMITYNNRIAIYRNDILNKICFSYLNNVCTLFEVNRKLEANRFEGFSKIMIRKYYWLFEILLHNGNKSESQMDI